MIIYTAAELNARLRQDIRWRALMASMPEWSVQFVEDPEPERVSWRSKKILLTSDAPEPEFRIRHVLVHSLRHRRRAGVRCSSRFTPREEDQADFIAECSMSWGGDLRSVGIVESADI